MNPKDIAAKRFEKSALGYKPEEVDEFLKSAAIELANAIKDKEESEAKIIKLVEKINEYRQDEDSIRDALLIAQKQGKRIVTDAKEEADKIVAEAQTKRDSLLAEIANDCEALKRSEVEKIATAIKDENDKLNAVVAASKTQIELQGDKLAKLKAEVTDFKRKLLGMLEEQVRFAASLPEISDEEIAKIVSGQVKPAPNAVKADAPAAKPEADEAKSASSLPANKPAKPAQEKVRPNFGFGDSNYKKQDFAFDDLKFGQNKK